MELISIKELIRRRKKLVKLLEPIPIDELWSASMEAAAKGAIQQHIADIDAEILERTGDTVNPATDLRPDKP